jgi:separase
MEILADGKNARREDEMVWPAQVSEVAAAQSHINDVDDVDHDERVGRRHQGRPDCGLFDQPDLSSMPDDWCAISITEHQTTMFISRSQRNRQPVIFTLPLDRQGKREEEEECFTLDAALTELRQIIRESDTTARGARDVDQTDKAAKTQWWADRKALDRRLQELLDSIEFCWLGAFKVSRDVGPSVSQQ